MIRPPCGSWARIAANASRAQRNEPVRLTATVSCQSSIAISSTVPPGPNVPALLTSRSSRPQRSCTAANSAATDVGSATSVATVSVPARPPATASSRSARRPASATRQPASSSARVTASPMPDPAPVTTATPLIRPP